MSNLVDKFWTIQFIIVKMLTNKLYLVRKILNIVADLFLKK